MSLFRYTSTLAIIVGSATLSGELAAADLDFSRPEFSQIWRKNGTGNTMTFNGNERLSVNFTGPVFSKYNTQQASYSKCQAGKDGGANLCISGANFDCAFFTLMSKDGKVNLSFVRGGPSGDTFCRAMEGDYTAAKSN